MMTGTLSIRLREDLNMGEVRITKVTFKVEDSSLSLQEAQEVEDLAAAMTSTSLQMR